MKKTFLEAAATDDSDLEEYLSVLGYDAPSTLEMPSLSLLFITPSGASPAETELLRKMISAMALPSSEHKVLELAPALAAKIEAERPRAVVTLGAAASQALLPSHEFSELRGGQWDHVLTDGQAVAVFPTYDPAYLLQNIESKKEAWEHLKKVLAFLST